MGIVVASAPGLRIYGLEDPLRVFCASQRNADPPATVAHRDHLIARHLVQVMLTDLPPVRVGGGFDTHQTSAGYARDHYTPIVCATAAMNQSVGFEALNLLGHPAGSYHQRLRQVAHPCRPTPRLGEDIQHEEIEHREPVGGHQAAVQRLEETRRRFQKYLPAASLYVVEPGQLIR
jgi:hypothetical protein